MSRAYPRLIQFISYGIFCNMSIEYFDSKEMKTYGFDPLSSVDRELWLATTPDQYAETDYSQDHQAYGGQCSDETSGQNYDINVE